MIFLKLYFSLVTLFTSCSDVNKGNIVIIGKAVNEKDGAWVVSNRDKKRYYLDGVDSWDEKIDGKTVKVWGKLYVEKLEEIHQEPGLPYPQQLVGVKRTILKAKWKLIK